MPLAELQAELDAYLEAYNRKRAEMALAGLTSLESLAQMQEASVPPGESKCGDRLQGLDKKKVATFSQQRTPRPAAGQRKEEKQ